MKKRYIHIRNWDRFQHPDVTRNRRTSAPWIKDYTAQDDDDDFRALTLAEQGLLHSLRRAYARRKARGMPSDTRSISAIVNAQVTRKQLDRLNHAGFIVFSASKTQADLQATLRQKAVLDEDIDKDGEEESQEQVSVLPSVVQDPEPEPATNGRTDGWNLETLDPQTELAKIATAADWLA